MSDKPKKKCTACDARRRRRNRMQKPTDHRNLHMNPTDVDEDLHKPKDPKS